MKKSIFLFFAAILCAIGMNAAQVTPNGKYFYFKTSSTWNVDGPRYAVYFVWRNGGGEDKTWASCQTVPGTTDILYVTAPGEFWDIYFCRMNGSTTDNKDANVWNKTDKLQYDGSKNFWTKSTGWNGTTTYSTYVPAISSVTLSDNGTSIISGTGTQADPYLVYTETTIKVKGAGTKVLDDPDAKINYNFKQGTTSKQESTSATYQFTASATADTEYTINLDGYTKVNTTKSTVTKSATALYYKTVERAEETNTVTISYKCGDKDVQTGITEVVGVSTTSSFTAPTVTGYKFTNWTIGAGIDLKAGTASDATITVVTKSASSDYTLVANYEEVLETVYFINTPKWTSVKVYAYSPENHAWPGVDATKEAEKIGEYEVYSYTATQGKYANVIFNGSGGQTADLVWTEGVNKYYIHNYNSESGWYTQSEAEELLVVPVVEETVYFVNNKKWTKVQAYAWNATGNNSWPGVALTPTGEKVADFDVYSYTAPQGYANVIFNNKTGDSGEQSADFVWTNGKYYYMDAANNYEGGTKEEVAVLVTPDPLATGVYLAGDMTNKDNWDVNKKEFKKAIAEATTASVTVTLEAQTYKFKLVIDGAWKGNTGTMQRGGDAVHEGGWSFDKDGYDDNCQIVADIAGDYTFTWNLTDKKLTVTYPPLPKYTVTAIAENGSVTGAGEYEHGSEATLVATPNAGYAFKNWTKESEEVSTEATYTFTVTADVELVANFVPEETHEVTVSYLCNATPIPGQTTQTLAVGVTTPSTITAPAITHYTFDGWTLGTGVQAVDANANPIQITTKAEGEYTLTANYTKIELTYTVEVPAGTEKCFIRGAFDGWDKFHEMELKDGETNIFTLTIDGAVTTNEYKYACQASWEYEEQKEDGGYVENRTWTALDRVEKWAKPVVVTYQLKGVGGWDQPGIELVQNPGNDKEYMLTCQAISATDAIKVVRLEDGVIKNYYGKGTVKDGVAVTVNYDGDENITLPEGKYNFYFDTNEPEKKLWIAAATDCGPATITLTTGDNSAVIAANIGNTVNVVIERSFTANDGYYTLCVPFNMDPSVIGKAYSLGTITEHVAGEGININLEEETYMLSAGMPYLVLPKANMSELVVENVTIETDEVYGQNVTNGEGTVKIFFEGFYSAPGRTTNGTTEYYVGNNGYLYNGEVEIRGLSGLFTITDENNAPLKVRARVVTREEVETGIDNNQLPNTNIQKVLENGQLIIIRNGEKFNAQGQKL